MCIEHRARFSQQDSVFRDNMTVIVVTVTVTVVVYFANWAKWQTKPIPNMFISSWWFTDKIKYTQQIGLNAKKKIF